jgi:glycosyltransferase involved in cell wall biosynthesis
LRLLYVGKFENRKGIHLIPEILFALKRKAYPLKMQFVGDGPGLNSLRETCERVAPAGSCEFSGKLSHAETIQSYQRADFVVFPSVRDTSGAVALEALSCGCPVVCFGHQGAAWMVSGETGILVSPNAAPSIQALADVFATELITCHSEPNRHDAMREAARQRAESLFSWPAKAQLLTEIYHSILQQQS